MFFNYYLILFLTGKMPVYKNLAKTTNKPEEKKEDESKKKVEDEASKKRREEMDAEIQKKVHNCFVSFFRTINIILSHCWVRASHTRWITLAECAGGLQMPFMIS